MANPSLLAVFIPTFFLVSLSPGMCMTLSLTLGMTIGVRRTLWMMWGELVGVALVATAAVIGAASLLLAHPLLFASLRFAGACYLVYLGIRLWRSADEISLNTHPSRNMGRRNLALQGFLTAVANPKGWAFMIALLPPFIDQGQPLLPQLAILLAVLLSIEFFCLVVYAGGGRRLRLLLEGRGGAHLLNRLAGAMMAGVGIWLATG
jgi:threonine/homoserine/homoserine lactone efflux protein